MAEEVIVANAGSSVVYKTEPEDPPVVFYVLSDEHCEPFQVHGAVLASTNESSTTPFGNFQLLFNPMSDNENSDASLAAGTRASSSSSEATRNSKESETRNSADNEDLFTFEDVDVAVFDSRAPDSIGSESLVVLDDDFIEVLPRLHPNAAPHLRDHMYSLNCLADSYRCGVCGYTDVSRHGVKMHARKHSSPKSNDNYKCCYCGYTAARRQHVKQHLATHFKDKPYRCPMCDYSASQKQSLVAHMHKHYSWKPFKCHLCSYSALRKQHLVVHMHKHLTQKPYKCDVCDFSTSWKEYLAVHKKRHPESKSFKPWSE